MCNTVRTFLKTHCENITYTVLSTTTTTNSTDLGVRYHRQNKVQFIITLTVTLPQRFLKHIMKKLHDNVFPKCYHNIKYIFDDNITCNLVPKTPCENKRYMIT